jgi:hypothetical protein
MPDDIAGTRSSSLIAADKVIGTGVYDTAGEKLGTVDHIMLDKASGQAIYAVMSFGGFLGIGQSYHPLPWSTLKYDPHVGGYVVAIDKKMLRAAPYFERLDDFRWTAEYSRMIDQYYGAPPYWL